MEDPSSHGPAARRKAVAALLAVVLAVLLAVSVAWWKGRPAGSGRPVPSWVARVSQTTRATRPDILLVVYDARRRDDFSFGPHGNGRADTPFLARFADAALQFPNAVSPGCWTAPVHAALFSGLSVCELGNDYYNTGFASFPDYFLSLAEILALAGYHTAALADHPYFFNANLPEALVRGFRQWDVVNDFTAFPLITNIATPAGRVERRTPLFPRPELEWPELREAIERFNRREEPFGSPLMVDVEPETGLLLPRLDGLYAQSQYFERRYRQTLDDHVLPRGGPRPFFLFLNLHMSTIAEPDPALFSRWLLETLLVNLHAKGGVIHAGDTPRDVKDWLGGLAARLSLPAGPFPSATARLKQIFDNRFYDRTFRAAFEHLDSRGLTENLLTVVTSDHGQSFREHGEDLLQHGGARPYEYITNVPLIIRFPRGSKLETLHRVRSERVSLLDLFPTLVEAGLGTGVFERSLPIRGRSLVERIQANDFERVLTSECSLGPSSHEFLPESAGYAKAVQEKDLKLIHAERLYHTPQNASGWPVRFRLDAAWTGREPRPTLEALAAPLNLLYDLAKDPLEEHDVAALRPAEVERLRRLPSSWTCEPLRGGGRSADWDPAARDTLKALGYLQ